MSGEVGQACWFCGGQLVWDNDYNYDEVFGDGEGIVAMLHCTECGAGAWFIQHDEEDEEQENGQEEEE